MKYFSILSVLLHTAVLLTWPTMETASRYPGQNAPITISLEPLHSGLAQAGPAFSETAYQTGQQTAPGVDFFRSGNKVHRRVSQQPDEPLPESLKKRRPPDLAKQDSGHTASTTKPDRPVLENVPVTNRGAGKIVRAKPKANDFALLASATSGAEPHDHHTQGTPLPAGTTAVRSDILSSLSQAFTPYFRYPQLARRRGWQGVVELGVHINADGRLSRIWIKRSSGHRILDKAAEKSLYQVTTIPNINNIINGHGLEMVLPVEYRLIDS